MHAQKSHALLLTKRNADGHGSEMPSLIMDRLLDSFIHRSSSKAALFELSSLQTSQVLLASPLLTTTFIVLMGCLWKANHHNGSFPLPILPKKDKIKSIVK
jgi:hypothetical protein